AAAPRRTLERPAELELGRVPELSPRAVLPRARIPDEDPDPADRLAGGLGDDHEVADAVKLPRPPVALDAVDRVVVGARPAVVADPTHHLGVGDEAVDGRDVALVRWGEQQAVGLDHASACSRSPQIASTSSRPTERRISPVGIRSPSQRCRLSNVEVSPPRLVAFTTSFVRVSTARASSTSNEITPEKPG